MDELLATARQMNPDVAAAALDTEAALARVEAAGRLPDPSFRAGLQNGVVRNGDIGWIDYTFRQEFPLWGKLGLQRDIARAEAGNVRELQRGVDAEIAARIKTVFANYYASYEGYRLTQDLSRTVGSLVEATQRLYAHGLASQEDAIRAEIEKTRLRTELVRFQAGQRRAAAQLNALLNRPANAPLAPPGSLRPLPPQQELSLTTLVERTARENPIIAAEHAQITVAEKGQELVKKSWYPDVMVGLGPTQNIKEKLPNPGFNAEVSFNIPLQWGLRDAREREAAAKLAAARARRDAAAARMQGQVEEAFWALDAARQTAKLLQDAQIPEANLALQSALRAYELARSDLTTVLQAEQRVFDTMLEHLKVLVEQQVQLAEIERLIGTAP